MKRLIARGRFRGLMSARALSVGYARKRDERRDGYGNTWITIPFDYKKPNSK